MYHQASFRRLQPIRLPALVIALLACLAVVQPVRAQRDTRVADAAERRDMAALDALVNARADVNVPQPDGATALQWAAHWGDTKMVDLLLRAGADVDAANDHGVTPLGLAAESQHLAVIERLLAARANPNAAVKTGASVLMTAARTGNAAIVGALLKQGAKADAAEPLHGQTALMWAAAQGHPDAVRVLLAAGASVGARSKVRRRTVQTANRYGDQNSVRGVIEVDLGSFTPLLFAARSGDEVSAKHLLAAGADVNDATPGGASALVIAAHSGNSVVAHTLLRAKADPNAAGAGYAPLHAAVLRGDMPLVEALLAAGASVDVRLAKATPSRYYSKDYAFNDALIGATPYWLAARFGEPAMMRAVVKAGADPLVTMPDGMTALMAAVIPTRGLGTFNAGDRRDRYQGPADVAAKADDEDGAITIETGKVAIELGSPVNAANQDGDTALHLAAGLALNRVVRFLAEQGALLDAKNKRGQTPLALTAALPPRTLTSAFFMNPEFRKGTATLLRELGAKE